MKNFTKNEIAQGRRFVEALSEMCDDGMDITSTKVLKKAAVRAGVKTVKITAGAYNTVLISNDIVFKVNNNGYWASDEDMKGDVEYIKGARKNPKYRPFFPPTEFFEEGDAATVMQRRIPNVSHGKYKHLWAFINEYALKMFDIGDMHEYNFGWHNGHPVFIDINDSRPSKFVPPKKFYSWKKALEAYKIVTFINEEDASIF